MKKLQRSSKDKRIFGVCGGFAAYFSMQPAVFRLFCLISAIIIVSLGHGLPGFLIVGLIYLSLTYIIPSDIPVDKRKPSKIKLRNLMLYKLNEEKMITGACAGLGDSLNIDPTLIRISLIIPVIFTGILPGIVIYALYSWIVPEKSTINFNITEKKENNSSENSNLNNKPVQQASPQN